MPAETAAAAQPLEPALSSFNVNNERGRRRAASTMLLLTLEKPTMAGHSRGFYILLNVLPAGNQHPEEIQHYAGSRGRVFSL
jgi:hypothetical protein